MSVVQWPGANERVMHTLSNPTDLLPLVGLGAEQPWPRGAARLDLVACVGGREIWSAGTPEGEAVSVTTFAAEPTATELESLALLAAGLSEIAGVQGVVRLLESNTRRGYIVTEALVGTLSDSPALGLDLGRKLEVMQALCATVEALHARGRCHGGLRPEVVGLLDDLAPRLLEAGGQPREAGSSRVFAAPETVDGDPPDPRSDVYSLGRILAFLVLGAEPPDERENIPRLDCLARAPAGISRIVRRATCAEPLLRYSGVAAFSGDLKRYGDFEHVGLMLPNADEQNFTGLSSPPVSSHRDAVVPSRHEPVRAVRLKQRIGLAAGVVVVAVLAVAMLSLALLSVSP